MNRRSFITTALAGLGAVALLPQVATASEPETLTVKEWAEKHRIEKWDPLELSYLPIVPTMPAGWVYLRFHDSKPPRIADRPARFLVLSDEPDPFT